MPKVDLIVWDNLQSQDPDLTDLNIIQLWELLIEKNFIIKILLKKK